jgi:hypothetical protein
MAFATLWSFGLVWGVHIVAGWRTRQQRLSGAIAVTFLVWLSDTGYLLYYLTDDHWRGISAIAHWTAGLALPVLLAAHIFLARRRARRH